MLPEIRTARLRLTPVGRHDLDLMRALNADEDVMRNLAGRAASRDETDAEWRQRLQERSEPERGLGYWTGRCDGEFVGWWGLGACPWDRTTANLGYRLRPTHWGRGLATEGGVALLEHAFRTVGLASVWASTTRHHGASQRVLAKLGMRHVGIRFDQAQYEVSARDWRNGPALVRSRSAQVSADCPFYDRHADAYDALITDPVEPWVEAVGPVRPRSPVDPGRPRGHGLGIEGRRPGSTDHGVARRWLESHLHEPAGLE